MANSDVSGGNLISKLRCVNCGAGLKFEKTTKLFRRYSNVESELKCLTCTKIYPVINGIPVMFKEDEKIMVLVDSVLYKNKLHQAEQSMKVASQYAGSELESLQKREDKTNALSWEILFWEKWKDDDDGFLNADLGKINQYLMRDIEGGGRLKFLEKVKTFNGNMANKCLLNIGAGRDYLLERFLVEDCEVVEQDIVLEPLLYLKRRGASFCICCDARDLPFDNDTFDIATAFGVIHHIWPLNIPIGELARVTRGNIHINEPNFFALTRLGLLLPGPIKRRLKKFYSGEGSHSPYEKSINPYSLDKIVTDRNCECVDLSFQKDSWIGQNSLLKKILWMMNMLLVNLMPLFSAHFDMVFTKKTKTGRKLTYRKFASAPVSKDARILENEKLVVEK